MMKTTTVASAIALLASLTTVSTVQAQDCEYQRDYDIELDAAQIQTLEIDAGAGPIEARGEGGSAIRITHEPALPRKIRWMVSRCNTSAAVIVGK
jgi:hypothetical protein